MTEEGEHTLCNDRIPSVVLFGGNEEQSQNK